MHLCLCFVFSVQLLFCNGLPSLQHANNDTVLGFKSLNSYQHPDKSLSIFIMLHMDKALTKRIVLANNKYKLKEKIIKASTVMLKDVENIFRHPSLNLSLTFKLIDVKALKGTIGKLAMDENVSKYLKSYCEWQAEKKTKKSRLWYSILFTGLDLFYIDGFGREIRRSTGRGYMNGACSLKNSCTILEWQSKNIAYVLAHEIAHSLGVFHDGPPHNECQGHRYIMDATYSPHNPAKAWSPCTKRDLRTFFNSRHSWCLRPKERNIII